MKQTLALKLEPTPPQHQALRETLEAFNAGCQYVADTALARRCANKIAIQPVVYRELRNRFGLSSQMAIRAIAKAIEAYKRDKAAKPVFDPHGAMVYDPRLMSFKGVSHVSLLTLSGRVVVAMRYGAYQAARMDRIQGQCDLVYREGAFYLYATIDLPSPPPQESGDVLGIDLGIVNVAVDSEGDTYTGQKIRQCRRRFLRLR